MRLILLALLVCPAAVAAGQSNPPASPHPDPIPGNSVRQFNAPSFGFSLDAQSPRVSLLPATPATPNWTGLASPQPKSAIPAQLLTRSQNPIQFLALNQHAPQVVPNNLPRGHATPIPTTFPDAHFENIPTTWPGLKFLLVDQAPSASKPTEAPIK
jgi:hypothetical protein